MEPLKLPNAESRGLGLVTWLVGEAGQLCDDFCVANFFLLDPQGIPQD